ncbi:MAG: Tn3 family transposase [Mycobacteriales bacterium]
MREANARLVNAHHQHPLARLWGGGTLSSSDGQRFPQRGRSLTARALSRYFLDEGTTTYTHVSDQHSTYGTKVIPTTWREAVAVLDEIFGNPTDLPIAEHTTDTAGQTLATFGIFDLAGLQFSPRIRDIGRPRFYRLGAGSSWRSRYPHAGPLLTQPIQTQLIADHRNDLLRLVGSMKFGHTTASLLIAKLHASCRQNSLARALQEYGRLVRTIYLCRYVANEELRRRVRRQLNKSESLHALRRELFFAHQGHVRQRHLDDQVDQALCLTLVTNAAILWDHRIPRRRARRPARRRLPRHRRRRGAPDTRAARPHQLLRRLSPSTSKPNCGAKDTVRSGYRLPEQARHAEGTRFAPLLREPLAGSVVLPPASQHAARNRTKKS